jgi:cyclic pyranopterin phosphate synthase
MIDISEKPATLRTAIASGIIKLKAETIERIRRNDIEKGDLLTIARVSAINGVKKVPELIPFCHPIPINNVELEIEFGTEILKFSCIVKSIAKTGVEMEALAGVCTALLNVWDVVKKYEKDDLGQYPSTQIMDIKVEQKIVNRSKK